MNWAHVHLVVNHVPALLIVVALVLLASTARWKSDGLSIASLILLVAAAVIAGGTYLTGEPAEDVVQNLPGVSKPAIEEHEEAAEAAALASAFAGLLAAAGLVARYRQRTPSQWLMIVTIVAALAAAVLMVRAANLGGYIRHPEIARSRFQSVLVAATLPLASRPTDVDRYSDYAEPAQEGVKVTGDDGITFTGSRLESRPIKDGDPSMAIGNQARLLEPSGYL